MVIHEDEDKSLWLGTFGGGLIHLNHKDHKVTIYDKSLGLADDNVVGILPYKEDNLLVSTYNGLSLFNTITEVFQSFFEEDGLTPGGVAEDQLLEDDELDAGITLPG